MAAATDRQLSYLRALVAERDVTQHGITDVDALARSLTKQAASRFIDTLLTIPRSTRPAPRAEARVAPNGSGIQNGTYTVVDGDAYVTLRIKPHWNAADAARGSQVVQYLSGPDNSTDFTGFAFLNGTNVRVWGRMRGHVNRQVDALSFLISADSEGRTASREQYAIRSSRCSNCGRRLTVPASLHRGLGPDCAARLGAVSVPAENANRIRQTAEALRPAAQTPPDAEAAFTVYSGEGTFAADTMEEVNDFVSTLTTQYEVRDRYFNHVATGNEDMVATR